MQNSLDLSLIIPCYNEEKILRIFFEEIINVLSNSIFNYELIFIDDCSTDKTREIIDDIIRNNTNNILMRKIFHTQNQGRGYAVTDGIKVSRGEIAGFIDTDLSTPPCYIPALVIEIKKGADIATALRFYKLSWTTIPRWIITKAYRFLVTLLLGLDLKDTETGCKFFNREKILPILEEIKDNYWFWDTEIMVRSYIKGMKIVEMPSIFIRRGLYSRVKIFRDSMRHFINLLKFRRELQNKGLFRK
jgi:glycosyltransferase involved in cell wall biosynthesis